MNKFELVKKEMEKRVYLSSNKNLRLLDVGCRGCELKAYLGDLVEYQGVDLFQNEHESVDFVLNVENGLPMKDETYDFVVSLDLLEHLNDFQSGLDDLFRVSQNCLIIMLPNMSYAPLRFEFLLSGSLSRLTDKYDLKYGKTAKNIDRHRWLTVIPQMDNYMQEFAENNNAKIEIIRFQGSIKRRIFSLLPKMLGLSPSIWSPASLYVIEKAKQPALCS